MPLDIQAPVDPLTGLSASAFGLYIHFPYCLARCPYCDFAVTVAKPILHRRYAQAVRTELALRLEEMPSFRKRTLDSVFFGGGTPSLWEPRELAWVLEEIAKELRLSSTAEISLEANPEVSDSARFRAYQEAGVNRLSLGVQSFHPKTLKALGRAHDRDTALAAFRSARAAGFQVVSMDFIYGAPGQLLSEVVGDAREAVELRPDHLSAYALTVDRPSLGQDTAFSKLLLKGRLQLPPEAEMVEMLRALEEIYEAAGLRRYEVSNFALPGRHSRHNALYWTGGDYLALGAGATGMWREGPSATRYQNQRSAEKYLRLAEEGRLPEQEREQLSTRELFEERLSMGLRLRAGLDVVAVCAQFGEDFERRRPLLEALAAEHLAEWEGRKLRLTRQGFNLHSEICARLM